ncbi:MAG TPA: tetratricopeptide repeat protein, partial [Sandaracinaceae bacterium]
MNAAESSQPKDARTADRASGSGGPSPRSAPRVPTGEADGEPDAGGAAIGGESAAEKQVAIDGGALLGAPAKAEAPSPKRVPPPWVNVGSPPPTPPSPPGAPAPSSGAHAAAPPAPPGGPPPLPSAHAAGGPPAPSDAGASPTPPARSVPGTLVMHAPPLPSSFEPGGHAPPATNVPGAAASAPAPIAPAPAAAVPTNPTKKKRSGLLLLFVVVLGAAIGLGILGAGAAYVLLVRNAENEVAPAVASTRPAIPSAPAVEPPATGEPGTAQPTAAAAPAPQAAPAPPPAPAPQATPTAAATSGDPSELVRRGESALRLRRYDEARAAFAGALAIDDANADAHAGMAQVALATGDAESALRHAERVVQLRRMRAGSHVLLGDARRASGDIAGARRAYLRALSLDEDHADARARLDAL